VRYNRLTLIGRLCADPADKTTKGGKRYAGFNLAVDDGWGDNKETVFVHVRVFGKPADAVLRFCRKGSLALFDGKIMQDRWEADGRKHERLVMHAFQMELGPKNAERQPDQRQQSFPPKSPPSSPTNYPDVDETPF